MKVEILDGVVKVVYHFDWGYETGSTSLGIYFPTREVYEVFTGKLKNWCKHRLDGCLTTADIIANIESFFACTGVDIKGFANIPLTSALKLIVKVTDEIKQERFGANYLEN